MQPMIQTALTEVAIELAKEWEAGRRSSQFDLEDMVEVLNRICDKLAREEETEVEGRLLKESSDAIMGEDPGYDIAKWYKNRR